MPTITFDDTEYVIPASREDLADILNGIGDEFDNHETRLESLEETPGDARNIARIVDHGAEVWDPDNPYVLPDNSPAFRAAWASQEDTVGIVNTPWAVLEAPAGVYYVSEPVWIPNSQSRLFGQGREATIIAQSYAFQYGSASGAVGFAGPVIIAGQSEPVTWGPDLFGGSGRSLRLDPAHTSCVILSDARVWRLDGMTAFTIEGRFKVNTGAFGNIIGSGAYDLMHSTTNRFIGAIRVEILDVGAGPFFQTVLTTVNGTYQANGTGGGLGGVTPGSTYNFCISYDGAHLRLYVNGVHVAGTAATGAVSQECYEGVCIGQINNDVCNVGSPTADGWVQSIRLSNNARHTGTGSYTNPSAAFTADNHTLALYNWDQGDPWDSRCPWVQGQVFFLYGPTPSPALHYCRLLGGYNGERQIENLSILCDSTIWGGSGIVLQSCFVGLVRNAAIWNATWMGLLHADGASFYSRHEDLQVANCNIGYVASPYSAINVTVTGGHFCAWVWAGNVLSLNVQPAADTVFTHVYGGAGFGNFQNVHAINCSTDAEGVFSSLRASAIFADCGVITQGCNFLGNGGDLPNVLLTQGMRARGWHSQGDIFSNDNGTTSGHVEAASGLVVDGPIVIEAMEKFGDNDWTTSPEITRIRFVDDEDENCHGTKTISGTDTFVDVSLAGMEFAPADYDVGLTVGNPVGSPSAGAYIPFFSNKTSTGFRINLTAAPGGGKSIDINWAVEPK